MALKRAAYTRPLPGIRRGRREAAASRRAWGSGDAAVGVIPGVTGPSADLGGSSKYSSETLED
jgi:hypothetical protein